MASEPNPLNVISIAGTSLLGASICFTPTLEAACELYGLPSPAL